MSTAQHRFRLSIRLICRSLIASFVAAFFSACSSQYQPQPTDPDPALEQSPTSQVPIEPTLEPVPTLPPFDATALSFEEGKHNRDETCSRVFDFQKTSYGPLSIVIASNLVEQQDQRELAAQVVDLYLDLSGDSPVPMDHPLTVTILSTPNVGECYSTGDLVFVSPDALDSKSFIEDLLGAATGIREYWVLSGLASLALDEQPDLEKLKTWYLNTDDLDMAGLFFARFLESWATEEEREIARMSATSLVQFSLEVENIQPDMLGTRINNSVRTRWLESLGVHRTVTYPYDGYFAGFLYSQTSECELYVKTDNMYFCLNRISSQEYFDEVSEAEFFIYQAHYGRKALAEYIMSEAPSVRHLMNPEETISFEVRELGGRLGYTSGNTIILNKSSVYFDILHEVVHTFEWNSTFNNDTLWMAEGFADYLGMLLPIYYQTEKRAIFEDLSGRVNEGDPGNFPGTSYWFYLDAEQLEAAKAWYLAQGGRMVTEESIDPRLFADAVAFATMHRPAHAGSRGISIGEKYDALVPGFRLAGQDGMELSYTQAASLIAWLCDTYTLDRVLDVYVNHAEDGLLDGKSYDELKSDWQANLLAKGEGIAIPGAP